MVVDAHHHLWDPTRRAYPWMGDELASIRRRFDAGDLKPLLDANGIDCTVVVQTVSSLDETREFMQAAAENDFIAGVVGWVDLTDPSVATTIEELKRSEGGTFLVGIRHQVHDEPDPDWLLRDDVQRGIAAVFWFALRKRIVKSSPEVSPNGTMTCLSRRIPSRR